MTATLTIKPGTLVQATLPFDSHIGWETFKSEVLEVQKKGCRVRPLDADEPEAFARWEHIQLRCDDAEVSRC